jgi:hypothetical protein
METFSQAMGRLEGQGYRVRFDTDGSGLRCGTCGQKTSAEEASIDETVRFEGASDPGDEAVLFAIVGSCDHRGLYGSAYGPEAPPEAAGIMAALTRRHASGDGRDDVP